jgi:hypothetical protein
LAQLRKVLRFGRRTKNLGHTPTERAWNALKRRLSRLWARLRESRMSSLAAHLQDAIQFNLPHVTYQPPDGTPPWNTEEPRQS